MCGVLVRYLVVEYFAQQIALQYKSGVGGAFSEKFYKNKGKYHKK